MNTLNTKVVIALLVAGVSAVSIAAYIGLRTMSSPPPPPPPPSGCQPGWHEFLAGVDDNFVLPTEPAIPSIGLQQFIQTQSPQHSLRDFDEHGRNMFLVHTFTGVAPDPTQGAVVEANLELYIRPTISVTGYSQDYGIPATDGIALLFLDDNSTLLSTGWSRSIGLNVVTNIPGLFSGQWLSNHPPALLQLDLHALPNADGSTTDLIQDLAAYDVLDIYVQDDTTVDYLKLRVRHSCFSPPPIRVPADLEPGCTDDIWECGAWSACSAAGQQTRVCALTADCPGAETPKPAEEQTCTPPIRVPVDRGPAAPACLADGALCVSDASCCSGVCGAAGCVPAPPVCGEVGQPCSATSPCCEGLSCEPSAGALWCTTPTTEPPAPKPTDFQAKKFLQNSEFKYGQSASFSISVENVGSGTAASPITVTDELPAGLTYLSFSDPYSNDWSCTASGQKVTCIYSGPDISPGGVLPALIITVAVASAQDFPAAMGDQVVNCAVVEYPSDINPNNDQGCMTAVITSP